MVELVAESPGGNPPPIEIGGARADWITAETLLWLSNWDDAGASAVAEAMGVGMPGPGEVAEAPGGRLAWVGLDQALWIGAAAAAPVGVAAMDQGDAWSLVRLSGPDVPDVLARLIPVDPAEIVPGRVVRTELKHMQSILIGCPDGAVDVAVFRSMAGTLARDLEEAMSSVAARRMI